MSMCNARVRAPFLCAVSLLALTACSDGLDLDMRGGLGSKFDTTDAAATATSNRPTPDANGVITYPNYQVAVAQPGDTVADVAARIGADAGELARYNGLSTDTKLRKDEVLALKSPVTALPGSVVTTAAPGAVDITSLAQGAIDSADVTTTALPAAQTGPEPVRHRVERGETAFTVARLYGVSVRSLADWNGLDRDFSVREGQYLLIPVAKNAPAAPLATAAAVSAPGTGSSTPIPPSATTPLPEEKPKPIAAQKAADPKPVVPVKQTSQARMGYPVNGSIIREYTKGKNDGVDISAPPGTSVKAAANGSVAAITKSTDDLPILVIKHPNNLLTVYANVDNIQVKKGDTVSRGQTVGKIRSGSSSYVHFEVRKGFDSVDPMPYLQ